jgi:type II secretory pathway pseudopilin PulG
LDDRGYLMAVLLIGMAITAVWMSALLPAWRQQVTRQREQDLIFRGEQYARAVALFYVRNQCTLPTNVDDLVARKFLRKKWKDPITNDDFILVPGAQPGQSGAQQPGGGAPGRGGTPVGQPGRAGAAPVAGVGGGTQQVILNPGGQTTGGRPSQPPTGQPSGGFPGQSSQSNQSISPGSGIAGVVSKSTGTSIMIYNGQQTYSAWQFMYQNALRTMGQTPQCGQNQPGGPGGRGGDGRGGPGGPTRTGGPGDGRGRGGEVPPPTPPAGIGRGRGGGL